MKKIILCFVIFLTYNISLFAAGPYDSLAAKLLKKVPNGNDAIAVMPFNVKSDSDAGTAISNEIISALSSKGAVVVERRNLNKILEELSLQQTGMMDEDTVSQVGRSVGAKYLVVGDATVIKKRYYKNQGYKVQARLINVETGKIISSAKTEVEENNVTLAYKKTEVTGPVEYPYMLNLFAGLEFFNYAFDGTDKDGDDVEFNKEDIDWCAGFQIYKGKSGFLANSWEFLYSSNDSIELDGADYSAYGVSLAWNLALRIPLWRFTDSLPYLTHIYGGIGFGYYYTKFTPDDDDQYDSITGNRWYFNYKCGIMFGITDMVLLNVHYVYNPSKSSAGWFSREDIDVLKDRDFIQEGSQVFIGLTLAP